MKKGFKIIDIAYIGMAVALIESCKTALLFLPNVELTSFWLIMFTLFMGWKAFIIVPIFIAIEASFYGPHVWVIMYLYVWPILIIQALLFRKCNVHTGTGHILRKGQDSRSGNQGRHYLVDLGDPV